MVITNYPAFGSAVCVSAYWLIVFIKAIIITPKIGKAPNVIPKEALGLLSRLVIIPLIVGWITLPWRSAFLGHVSFPSMAWLGSLLSLVALSLTMYCWSYMGDAWRIGIDPKEKNKLITDGPFKHTRHPIYALSMLLILGCYLSVQSQSMFVLFSIHWILFTLEALREERYLTKIYGATYKTYMSQTCRFLPLR